MERRIGRGTGNAEQRAEHGRQRRGDDAADRLPGNGRRRKGDDIAERLLDAVEGVRRLLPSLEGDAASKHAARQLWRAATSAGANYEEARAAESRADFVHKIRVATKELREANYWLRILQRSAWLLPGAADRLVDETSQLIAILVTSARTAKSPAPA